MPYTEISSQLLDYEQSSSRRASDQACASLKSALFVFAIGKWLLGSWVFAQCLARRGGIAIDIVERLSAHPKFKRKTAGPGAPSSVRRGGEVGSDDVFNSWVEFGLCNAAHSRLATDSQLGEIWSSSLKRTTSKIKSRSRRRFFSPTLSAVADGGWGTLFLEVLSKKLNVL